MLNLYFSYYSCWVTGGYDVFGDVFGHDAAGTDDAIGAYGDAAKDCGVGADGGAFFDQGRDDLPIRSGLKLTALTCGPGKNIVGEHDAMADENFVFDGDAFADEGVALYFTLGADESVFLDFNKGANFGHVAYCAAIKIDKIGEVDVFADFYRVCYFF